MKGRLDCEPPCLSHYENQYNHFCRLVKRNKKINIFGKKQMSSIKNILPIIHALAWLVCLTIPTLIYNGPYGLLFTSDETIFGFPELIAFCLFISFFYLNAFLLIPKLLSRKRILAYLVITILLVLIIGIVNAEIASVYREDFPARPFVTVWFYRIFICLVNLALSSSYRLIVDNFKKERNLKEKEKENLISELSFLRSQISPHFIFNILNSVVSLVRKRSDQAEPVLLELSSLMRYMLYESDTDKVSVKTMVMYLKSYINLQQLRFGDDVKIDFKIVDNSINDDFIEPMLFIPLVENAFKHGIGMIENPEISVLLTINSKNINIFVQNKFSSTVKIEKEKQSGIGLNNLKRRLKLLYADNHQLTITGNNNQFKATLNLQIP